MATPTLSGDGSTGCSRTGSRVSPEVSSRVLELPDTDQRPICQTARTKVQKAFANLAAKFWRSQI